MRKPAMRKKEWLLVFYTVPSKPVNNRMKIWRRLALAGAVQLKGAVYILPHSEEHYEFFQWLISEVTSMGGDGAFVKVPTIETMKEAETVGLFNRQREEEYREIEKGIGEVETKTSSVRKGSTRHDDRPLIDQVARLRRELQAIKRRDFFSTELGRLTEARLNALEREILKALGTEGRGREARAAPMVHKRTDEYRGRTWVTRKSPFVDRMASAWLIRRFIDDRAVFQFIEERQVEALKDKTVAFDVRGGEFTHRGDLCTFEVLARSFGIRDKALKAISEMVHELDMKDGKYDVPETRGIELILTGIRKTAPDDTEALEQGMRVFEMVYRSKTH